MAWAWARTGSQDQDQDQDQEPALEAGTGGKDWAQGQDAAAANQQPTHCVNGGSTTAGWRASLRSPRLWGGLAYWVSTSNEDVA